MKIDWKFVMAGAGTILLVIAIVLLVTNPTAPKLHDRRIVVYQNGYGETYWTVQEYRIISGTLWPYDEEVPKQWQDVSEKFDGYDKAYQRYYWLRQKDSTSALS